jgi:hypothetical protein
MKELKIEAAAWEIFEREIRDAVVGEDRPLAPREAVNIFLIQTYEALEPYLEAERQLAIAQAYRDALTTYGLPAEDMRVRAELEAERAWVDELVKGHTQRIAGLKGRYKNELQRVAMLHALREKLPAAEEDDLREPP